MHSCAVYTTKRTQCVVLMQAHIGMLLFLLYEGDIFNHEDIKS